MGGEVSSDSLRCVVCAGYMYLCGSCGQSFDAHPATCPNHARLPSELRNPPLPGRPRRLDWCGIQRQEMVDVVRMIDFEIEKSLRLKLGFAIPRPEPDLELDPEPDPEPESEQLDLDLEILDTRARVK